MSDVNNELAEATEEYAKTHTIFERIPFKRELFGNIVADFYAGAEARKKIDAEKITVLEEKNKKLVEALAGAKSLKGK